MGYIHESWMDNSIRRMSETGKAKNIPRGNGSDRHEVAGLSSVGYRCSVCIMKMQNLFTFYQPFSAFHIDAMTRSI